jgi:hypothetical protein
MHPTTQSRWVALARELDSVAIDPLSLREVGPRRLPAGVLIEDPWGSVHCAGEVPLQVTVRVKDGDGWTSLERVKVADLVRALPAPDS